MFSLAPAGSTSILRGIWFKDPGGPNSVPIEDESMVEQLEITYNMLQCRLSTTESIRSGSSSPKLGTDEESGTETTSAIGSIFSNPAKNFCTSYFHIINFAICTNVTVFLLLTIKLVIRSHFATILS